MARHLESIVYCSVCSLPPEYCEWGGSFEKCKQQLLKLHPDLYAKLYGADQLVTDLEKTSLDDKPEPVKKKKQQPQRVVIETQKRGKRKHVTIVSGLETVDPTVDLKKVAKQFASKFACGSGVGKTAEGRDEIVVQGDFAMEIMEILEEQFKVSEELVTMKEGK